MRKKNGKKTLLRFLELPLLPAAHPPPPPSTPLPLSHPQPTDQPTNQTKGPDPARARGGRQGPRRAHPHQDREPRGLVRARRHPPEEEALHQCSEEFGEGSLRLGRRARGPGPGAQRDWVRQLPAEQAGRGGGELRGGGGAAAGVRFSFFFLPPLFPLVSSAASVLLLSRLSPFLSLS